MFVHRVYMPHGYETCKHRQFCAPILEIHLLEASYI